MPVDNIELVSSLAQKLRDDLAAAGFTLAECNQRGNGSGDLAVVQETG